MAEDKNLDKKIQELIEKTKKIEKGNKIDLSSNEDLSIAIMNLISVEEHLFFSAGKTGKTSYFEVLNQVREMRKELLKKIINDYEGEIWCVSKHLLAASMRLMEVGTKALTKNNKKDAYNFFAKAYDLYNLFWGLNLGLIKPSLNTINFGEKNKETPIEYKKEDFFEKINNIIKNIINCCQE